MSLFEKDLPKINDKRKSTIKMKNKTFAIDAAPAATPPNPNIAAIMAMTKKMIVQRNISLGLKFKKLFSKQPIPEPCHKYYCAFL